MEPVGKYTRKTILLIQAPTFAIPIPALPTITLHEYLPVVSMSCLQAFLCSFNGLAWSVGI